MAKGNLLEASAKYQVSRAAGRRGLLCKWKWRRPAAAHPHRLRPTSAIMGANASSASRLTVQLPQRHYIAGDTLAGSLVVYVDQPVEVSERGVELSVQGAMGLAHTRTRKLPVARRCVRADPFGCA